jgi:hypothetical protein
MMETQRLDLGPNRWMAAGGLAFIYVGLWKGWMVRITAAPVRDVEFGRASFAGSPYGPFIVIWSLFLLCAGFPFVPLILPMGDSDVLDWGWLILLLPIIICAINLFRRRGQFGLYVSGDMTDVPVRIFIDRGKEETEPVRSFCEYIAALRAEAGDGKRRARTYLLFPWWASIVFAMIFMLMAGFGAYYGLKQMGLAYAEIYSVGIATLLTAIITTATQERALLFDREIRNAQSLLLRGDAEGAKEILRRVFERKPNHQYGGTLLKFADLMQCDLQRAEDVVIQQYNPRPNLPSRYHRIMDYKIWESRHGDSSH